MLQAQVAMVGAQGIEPCHLSVKSRLQSHLAPHPCLHRRKASNPHPFRKSCFRGRRLYQFVHFGMVGAQGIEPRCPKAGGLQPPERPSLTTPKFLHHPGATHPVQGFSLPSASWQRPNHTSLREGIPDPSKGTCLEGTWQWSRPDSNRRREVRSFK